MGGVVRCFDDILFLMETIFWIVVIVFIFWQARNIDDWWENIKSRWPQRIETLLEEAEKRHSLVEEKIDGSHLNEYLTNQKVFLAYSYQNFQRLTVRYKHDDEKMRQIANDAIQYFETISDLVSNQEMLDVCDSDASDMYYKENDNLHIVREEIEKRFKAMLGKEYKDPIKVQNNQPSI